MVKKIYLSIKAILKGHFTVLKHLFRNSVTLEYPEVHPFLNHYFRGRHVLEGCRGCGLCKRVCPSDAIMIEKNDNNYLNKYVIDYSKCIFCGNCMFYCPTHSMKMSNDYELAKTNKSQLLTDIYYKGV